MADDKTITKYNDYTFSLGDYDRDPFFETFDVFEGMDLKGQTLIKALNIVIQKADELYSKVENDLNTNKIPSFRYHEGNFERTLTNEDKILKSINKSLSMLEYEHVIINLKALTDFYKKAYYKSKIYEPFFKYIRRLFKKFSDIQDLIENFEKYKFEIDKLVAENQYMVKENSELKIQMDGVKKQLKKYDTQFRDVFLNQRVLKFFTKAVDRKIIRNQDGYNVFQVISRLLWEGRSIKKEVARSLGLTISEFNNLIKPYQELFITIGDKIDLNLEIEDIRRQKLFLNYEEFLKKNGLVDIPDVDEIQQQEEVDVEMNKEKEEKNKVEDKEDTEDFEELTEEELDEIEEEEFGDNPPDEEEVK